MFFESILLLLALSSDETTNGGKISRGQHNQRPQQRERKLSKRKQNKRKIKSHRGEYDENHANCCKIYVAFCSGFFSSPFLLPLSLSPTRILVYSSLLLYACFTAFSYSFVLSRRNSLFTTTTSVLSHEDE
jgi:hypothetical protein